MPIYPDVRPFKPDQPSVFDSPMTQAINTFLRWTGLDDPQSQVLALMNPMEVGPSGGIAGAIQSGLTKARGSLADTITYNRKGSAYQLRPDVVERLRHLYQVGASMPTEANWEGQTSDALAAFGGDQDRMRQWLRLWGATSPNTSVPVNTRESISALVHALENPGMPMTVPQAQTLDPVKITMAPSKVPNINRALAGEPLSGDKVEAMAGFMTGDARIPIDVHALHALGSASDKLQPELAGLRKMMTAAEKLPIRGSLSDTDIYLRYESAVKNALRELEPGRSVNGIFATLWEGTRHMKGLKPQGGPIDILRRKGLLEAGAMLDPQRLREVLKSQGWTASAIAGLVAALHGTDDAHAVPE